MPHRPRPTSTLRSFFCRAALETFVRDVRLAVRTLGRNPAFTVVAILTLALGIGMNTAIFSLVNTLLLRSLPYRNADRLVLLEEARPRVPRMSVAYLNYLDWRDQSGSVVGHVKLEGVTRTAREQMYWPYEQAPFSPMTLMMRTEGDPAAVASAVRKQVLATDPSLPIYNVRTMRQLLDDSVVRNRLAAVILSVFAAAALVLGSVGVYGVMAYTVGRRTREIGIRIALGAHPRSVVGLIVRQGMTMVAIGLAVGAVAALGVTRLLGSLLFEVSATDPTTLVGIAAVLALPSLLASYLPARRAARIGPMSALKCE